MLNATIRWAFNDGPAVLLSPAPLGRWIACLDVDTDDKPIIWGLGDTQLSAIADLNRNLDEAAE